MIDLEHEESLNILSYCIPLIYESGLFNELPYEIKEKIANNPSIAKLLAKTEISLEPRLSVHEYSESILRLFKVHPSQSEFYNTIIRICYIMMLVEKNPLVAQELRGNSSFTQAIRDIMR